MRRLDQELEIYAQSNIYPFHMPGHKRQQEVPWNPFEMDITEIDGFDDLHHAKGILREAQNRAARLYGADRSYYLVNGSTCGILAAVCAAVGRRKRILAARNCHRSVYHAFYLQELSVSYLYPRVTAFGIQGQILPEDVEKKLAADPDIAAIVITSPTYDGIVSDIQRIADISHRYGVPLIVDEAHGAHFGFFEHFPASAVTLGADIVIQSLHKTLPSLTQTALLHLCSPRVSKEAVENYLGIFETSSPSYLLMAGMEKCIRMLEEKRESLFMAYWEKLQAFYERAKDLTNLKVLTRQDFSAEEAFDVDASKIIITANFAEVSGKRLYDELLKRYALQMEMASGNYVLGMTSIMDSQKGFERLIEALLSMDAELAASETRKKLAKRPTSCLYTEYEKVWEIAEAQEAPKKTLSLADAQGEASAEFIYLYPPGIPMLVPGERITGKFLSDIRNCMHLGMEVRGLTEDKRIKVVNFS